MIHSSPVICRSAIQALGIEQPEIVALVGGGGKTSLMFQLAQELRELGSVLTTTTTKIARPECVQSPSVVLTRDHPDWIAELHRQLDLHAHVTLAHFDSGQGKLKGHEGPQMDAILSMKSAKWTLIEADGARQHPIKAPRGDEPLIPVATTRVIGIVGWDCLRQRIDDRHVHRAAIFRQILALSPQEDLLEERILERWLLHPEGFRKAVPPGARFVLLFNKCDSEQELRSASQMAIRLAGRPQCPFHRIVAGSVQKRFFWSWSTC